MDPLTSASTRFAKGVCAFLRSKRARVLRIDAAAADHSGVVRTLRMIERAPDNQRAFYLYEEPFTSSAAYFDGLIAKLSADYGHPIRLPTHSDPRARAAVMVAELRGEVLVGLVPRDARAASDELRAFTSMAFPPRVKLAVLGAAHGDAAVCFAVERPEGAAFGRPDEAIRDALEACNTPDGAQATAALLAGEELAKGNRDGARMQFAELAVLAAQAGDTRAAAQAWEAVAAVAKLDGLTEVEELARRRAERFLG